MTTLETLVSDEQYLRVKDCPYWIESGAQSWFSPIECNDVEVWEEMSSRRYHTARAFAPSLLRGGSCKCSRDDDGEGRKGGKELHGG